METAPMGTSLTTNLLLPLAQTVYTKSGAGCRPSSRGIGSMAAPPLVVHPEMSVVLLTGDHGAPTAPLHPDLLEQQPVPFSTSIHGLGQPTPFITRTRPRLLLALRSPCASQTLPFGNSRVAKGGVSSCNLNLLISHPKGVWRPRES